MSEVQKIKPEMVPLEEVSATKLSEFVSYLSNSEPLPPTKGKAYFIEALRELGFQGTAIPVYPDVEVDRPSPQAADKVFTKDNPPARKELSGEWVQIEIHRDPNAQTNRPVPISLNGDVILVPRGRRAKIRVEHLEILEHAEMRIPIKDDDDRITGWDLVKSYSYNSYGRCDAPTEEEIKAIKAGVV